MKDFHGLFDIYILTQRRFATNTCLAYSRDISQFIQFLELQKKDLLFLTVETIKDYLQHMYDIGLKTRSRARKIESLRTFFTYLHEYHDLTNWSEHLITPQLEQMLPQILSEEEMQLLFDQLEYDTSKHRLRNKTMFYLLYASGIRISELTNLRLSQIYWKERFIRVIGKRNKERVIPIPRVVMDNLKKMIEFSRKDYVFPVKYGNKIRPITRQAVVNILKKLWKKTGSLKPIYPHLFRHSYATHMLKNGANIRQLQLLLGHESLTSTQIYTHLETSYMRKEYDKKHPRA